MTMNLTREQIENMEAGREMDSEIAVLIFGKEVSRQLSANGKYHQEDVDGSNRIELPHYSTDIAAAWQVVNKFLKDRIEVQVHYLFEGECDNGIDWTCLIGEAMAEAETAELAISRAALLSKL
jgi:hypothetical protein